MCTRIIQKKLKDTPQCIDRRKRLRLKSPAIFGISNHLFHLWQITCPIIVTFFFFILPLVSLKFYVVFVQVEKKKKGKGKCSTMYLILGFFIVCRKLAYKTMRMACAACRKLAHVAQPEWIDQARAWLAL